MARHHCNISSKEAVLSGRSDAEIDPANSLQIWFKIFCFESCLEPGFYEL